MPTGEGQSSAPPTGCFKCGRPGHWSRDCPSSTTTSNPNPNPNPNPDPNPNSLNQPSDAAAGKKARKSRPKLTPELLLSDDGLGYVLRHFPRAFKSHGRDHEKVEKVGASRRVKRCLEELRERVARGGDPTKLHDTPTELDDQNKEPEQCGDDGNAAEEGIFDMEDPPLDGHGQDQVQEDMINEIYEMVEDDSSLPHKEPSEMSPAVASSLEPPEQTTDELEMVRKTGIQITVEQRARIEANRAKALERSKARASQTAA